MFSLHASHPATTPAQPTAGWAVRFAKSFARGLKRTFGWPGRVMAARQEMAMFAQMSEHDLRDIGLTRADVANASALMADELPSNFLSLAAGQATGKRKRRSNVA